MANYSTCGATRADSDILFVDFTLSDYSRMAMVFVERTELVREIRSGTGKFQIPTRSPFNAFKGFYASIELGKHFHVTHL